MTLRIGRKGTSIAGYFVMELFLRRWRLRKAGEDKGLCGLEELENMNRELIRAIDCNCSNS